MGYICPAMLCGAMDIGSAWLSIKAASDGGLFRGRGQSAIRTRTASKAKPGACLAAPVHDAVVGVDLPVSVKLTSSMPMPKADGYPGVCLSVAMKAVNLSPSVTYDPVKASTVALP